VYGGSINIEKSGIISPGGIIYIQEEVEYDHPCGGYSTRVLYIDEDRCQSPNSEYREIEEYTYGSINTELIATRCEFIELYY